MCFSDIISSASDSKIWKTFPFFFPVKDRLDVQVFNAQNASQTQCC